jgi:hypothetical protein
VKLTVPDINSNNMGRAAIKKHFGEAAGAGTDIGTKQVARINRGKGIKATDQLQRPTADPGNIGGGDTDRGIWRQPPRGFCQHASTDQHLAIGNHRLSAFARPRKAALHHQRIGAERGPVSSVLRHARSLCG